MTRCENCIYNVENDPCVNKEGVKNGGCDRGLNRSNVLSAKPLKEDIIKSLKEKVDNYYNKPKLIIIVAEGYNQSSTKYINNKCKIAKEIGILTDVVNISWENKEKEELEEELLKVISKFNDDVTVDGIIVQLPFPLVDEQKIALMIQPEKDVDGFHPINQGLLMRGSNEGLIPCTPLGATLLLEYYGIDVEGKKCCVVGRSNIVGKPMAQILINKGATVTVCNSKTERLYEHTQKSDIIFLATGNAKKFGWLDFTYNATIIDFGINFDEEGKLCGDLDIKGVNGSVKAYTPTPGGTGITTVLALMFNTVKAYENKLKKF